MLFTSITNLVLFSIFWRKTLASPYKNGSSVVSDQKNYEKSRDEFRSFYHIPAKLDRYCDLEFHQKFVEPIYKTESYREFRQAVLTWGDALKAQSKENETCFGAPEPPADARETFNFFTCDPITRKCACHSDPDDPSQEMMRQVRKRDDCLFVGSELGSPCDYCRMEQINNAEPNGFHQFYKELATIKTMTMAQLSTLLKGHLRATQDFAFMPWAARRICRSVDQNLECKPNGRCGCLDVPPSHSYKAIGGRCLARQGSICELTIESYMDWTGFIVFETVRKSECADPSMTCEKAVEAGAQTFKTCGGSL